MISRVLLIAGMAKFKKAILKVDTYHSPDGEVVTTRERLEHFADSFQRMSEAGSIIPVAWDHAIDEQGIKPLTVEEFAAEERKIPSARNTVGKLVDIAINAAGDSAELLLEITDPVAAGRADRNEVFISPIILDEWQDGHGTDFSDVLTHIDLVNHPVDHSQTPFVRAEPGAVALALRMGLSTQLYRLGTDMLTDPDEKTADEPELPEVPADEPEPDEEETEEAEEPTGPTLTMVLEALKALVGMLSALEQKQDTGDEEPDALPDTPDNDPMTVADPGFTAMGSRAGKPKAKPTAAKPKPKAPAKPAKPAAVDPAIARLSLQTRAAMEYAEAEHKKALAGRLTALLNNGQCSPHEHAAKDTELSAVRMSLGADNKPAKTRIEDWIADREQIPSGSFWDGKRRLASANVVDAPHTLTNEVTDTDADQILDRVFGKAPAK